MKWQQNLTHIVVVAAGTAALALCIALPPTISADGPAAASPENVAPVVTVDGISVSAALLTPLSVNRTLPGGKTTLAFQTTVTNPTQETKVLDARLQLMRTAPTDRMSRSVQLPTKTWDGPLQVTLKPGETRTSSVDVEIELKAGSSYQLHAVALPVGSDIAGVQPDSGTGLRVKGLRDLDLAGIALVQFSVAAADAVVEGK